MNKDPNKDLTMILYIQKTFIEYLDKANKLDD